MALHRLYLVVKHKIYVLWLQSWQLKSSVFAALKLWNTVSVVVVHGISCSVECGLFLVQISNLCPLHGRQILIHCITREVPTGDFLNDKIVHEIQN